MLNLLERDGERKKEKEKRVRGREKWYRGNRQVKRKKEENVEREKVIKNQRKRKIETCRRDIYR